MADPEPVDPAPEPVPGPPCRHLRSKGMFVYTDGAGDGHDDYDNTLYWCQKTLKDFGPDVGRAWRYLKELRLDRGPLTREEAEAELIRWAQGNLPPGSGSFRDRPL